MDRYHAFLHQGIWVRACSCLSVAESGYTAAPWSTASKHMTPRHRLSSLMRSAWSAWSAWWFGRKLAEPEGATGYLSRMSTLFTSPSIA